MSVALLVLGILAVLGVINARRPARSWALLGLSWISAWVTVELAPHLVVLGTLAAVALAAGGGLEDTIGWIGLGLVVLADAVAIPLILQARRTVDDLEDIVGELETAETISPYPRVHIVLPFLAWRRGGVVRQNGVRYSGPCKLDVYRPAAGFEDEPRPAIVHVHGGGWIMGSRHEQGVPLLGHLAANGWVGFNVDYRLSPKATWPAHLDDVLAALAWVREHADEYGVDPAFVAVTGGSAGGHLSAMAGLLDPEVAACVPFYGVYDFMDAEGRHIPQLQPIVERLVFKAKRDEDPERFRQASPIERIHDGAPPYFVIHGTHDSLVPVEEARSFVEKLRAASRNRVLYAEMRGGQHAFDVIPSWRTIPVIEAIERFLHTERAAARDRAATGSGSTPAFR